MRDLDAGDTRVFLGMIHHDDELEHFRARVAHAREHLNDFGIAGPCGYGRVDSAELPGVLRAHRESINELRRAARRSK